MTRHAEYQRSYMERLRTNDPAKFQAIYKKRAVLNRRRIVEICSTPEGHEAFKAQERGYYAHKRAAFLASPEGQAMLVRKEARAAGAAAKRLFLASPAGQEAVRAKDRARWARKHPKIVPAVPFLWHFNRNELVARCSALVPRYLPSFLREDIIGDMIVAVLAGEVSLEDLPNVGRRFIRKYDFTFKELSLSTPIGDGGLTFMGVLS